MTVTLDQARRIIESPGTTPQADWMVAGQLIAKHYRDHPEELKPVRLGVMTYDAAPRSSREALTRSLNTTRTMMDNLLRVARKHTMTRDQDPPRRVRKLGPAGSYSIENDGPDCWLIEHDPSEFEITEGGQTGVRPPAASPDLMEADPALKMGPTMMGDAVVRARAARAVRDRGAAFAAQFNERQRAKWGR
jgi:hypothetical protein